MCALHDTAGQRHGGHWGPTVWIKAYISVPSGQSVRDTASDQNSRARQSKYHNGGWRKVLGTHSWSTRGPRHLRLQEGKLAATLTHKALQESSQSGSQVATRSGHLAQAHGGIWLVTRTWYCGPAVNLKRPLQSAVYWIGSRAAGRPPGHTRLAGSAILADMTSESYTAYRRVGTKSRRCSAGSGPHFKFMGGAGRTIGASTRFQVEAWRRLRIHNDSLTRPAPFKRLQ